MLDVFGSPNVGIFAYATDEYCLIGKGLPDEAVEAYTKALDVPIHEITIGNSQQVGLYLNGNSTCLLVPSLITEAEEKALNELGIKYEVIETKQTALGNNLIVNDNYFFYMEDFEKSAVDKIKSALGVKGEELSLKDWEVIGSIIVVTSKGGLVQKNVPEDVIDYLSEKLKVSLELGTVNFGSHVIGGGVVVNDKGMVIGRASAGIEVTNADMAFGFLEK